MSTAGALRPSAPRLPARHTWGGRGAGRRPETGDGPLFQQGAAQ
ncbi:hypothetical protein [Streptomyces sp. NPDC058092]